MRKLIAVGFMVFAGWAGSGLAEDKITSVLHATPEWTGFTNADGSGIYNELLAEIFGAAGITVERRTVPMNRAVALVERGEADLTGGFRPDDRNFANVPIYETTFAAMYRADSGLDLTSPEHLKSLRVATAPQVSTTLGEDLNEVDSRSQAAKLLVSGRVDAYVDLRLPLEKFRSTGEANLDVANASDTRFDINPDDWVISTIASTQLYMLFPDTPRGNTLRAVYEDGTRALARSGRLAELYQQYGLEIPTVE
ncbi:substrate-binding periplasmic protein [Pacificoceanicola onchidii]|uniref:substrate-binding periplasmic protein n=1 Tax=Pacificoceanicola onchidii TaxID=2562685 RepID=UPI0014562329|nr:transporter substrate-binding domain-containing protein [Pacificoceanicola onchidii]